MTFGVYRVCMDKNKAQAIREIRKIRGSKISGGVWFCHSGCGRARTPPLLQTDNLCVKKQIPCKPGKLAGDCRVTPVGLKPATLRTGI